MGQDGRVMKVSYNNQRPQITLSGKKLKDSGFEPGDYIEAIYDKGEIVIKLKERFINKRQLKLIEYETTEQ